MWRLFRRVALFAEVVANKVFNPHLGSFNWFGIKLPPPECKLIQRTEWAASSVARETSLGVRNLDVFVILFLNREQIIRISLNLKLILFHIGGICPRLCHDVSGGAAGVCSCNTSTIMSIFELRHTHLFDMVSLFVTGSHFRVFRESLVSI